MNRLHAGRAVKAWVIATVFVLPFLDGWEVAAWLAVGAALGLAWNALPEAPPEAPPPPLPYADRYKGREIPRRPDDSPP